ncbi:MAG: UbiA prenyltransferase family protein [Rickettsiales bacterium]
MTGAAIVKLLRPRQWVKNVFVFAPLFFSPAASADSALSDVLFMFAAFCLGASGLYCLNDFCDRDSDKLHPQKRLRPVAAGTISPTVALILSGVLAASGLAIAFVMTKGGWVLAAYLGLTILYSFVLKRLAIVDVLTIALGFVLRVYAGAAAASLEPTVWILVCTGMLALFIALTKRRDDLTQELNAEHRESLGGYSIAFLDASFVMVSTALVVSYVVFTTDPDAMQRLGSDKLYLTIPFVIAGTLRHLQLTMVYKRSGSPTDLALSDPFLVIAVLGWIGAFAFLMYV